MQVLALYNSQAGTVKDYAEIFAALEQMSEVTLCSLDEFFDARAPEGAPPGTASTDAPVRSVSYQRFEEDMFDYILIIGGDGTIHHCVNHLCATLDRPLPPLLFLPMGTGNDFCRSLFECYDGTDPMTLWHRFLEFFQGAKPVKLVGVDVIKVAFADGTSRLVTNACSGGFSGQMQEIINENSDLKKRWGAMAYLRAAAEAMVDLQEYRVRFSLAEQTGEQTGSSPGGGVTGSGSWQDVNCLNFIIANGRYAAKGFEIAPEAQLSDGLMDIVIIEPAAAANLMSTAVRLVQGNYLEEEHIQFFQCRQLALQVPTDMSFSLDGELHDAAPVQFELIKHRFQTVSI